MKYKFLSGDFINLITCTNCAEKSQIFMKLNLPWQTLISWLKAGVEPGGGECSRQQRALNLQFQFENNKLSTSIKSYARKAGYGLVVSLSRSRSLSPSLAVSLSLLFLDDKRAPFTVTWFMHDMTRLAQWERQRQRHRHRLHYAKAIASKKASNGQANALRRIISRRGREKSSFAFTPLLLYIFMLASRNYGPKRGGRMATVSLFPHLLVLVRLLIFYLLFAWAQNKFSA